MVSEFWTTTKLMIGNLMVVSWGIVCDPPSPLQIYLPQETFIWQGLYTKLSLLLLITTTLEEDLSRFITSSICLWPTLHSKGARQENSNLNHLSTVWTTQKHHLFQCLVSIFNTLHIIPKLHQDTPDKYCTHPIPPKYSLKIYLQKVFSKSFNNL